MNFAHDEYTADELKSLINAVNDEGWQLKSDIYIEGEPGKLRVEATLVKHAKSKHD